ncbi:MAG TPA: HAD family hydrolase [Candidatus Thermoplasmatota archaeon]|nr:HAD family hydrolase [Candidatus Thermoplasmatota archaeon]
MGSTLADDDLDDAWKPRGAAPFDGVEAVAFDLDCTLVDILRLKERACEAAAWALADAGLDLDPPVAARTMMRLALEQGIDRDDVVDLFLLDAYGTVDPSLVILGRHAFDAAEEAEARPYPRAHRTLLELSRRGYRLALITDAPRHRALKRLQASRLRAFFEDVITVEDTPRGKVDSRPFERALARLNLPASALLMVGDNPRRDVGPAKALGCRTALATYGLQPDFASDHPAHRADREIRQLDDLLALVPDRVPRRQMDLRSGGVALPVAAATAPTTPGEAP